MMNLNDNDTNLSGEMEMAPLRIITQQTDKSNVHIQKRISLYLFQK